MNTIHLQLSRLAVGYKGKALISGIEIGVHRGEIVTLVGPNGSGKSTILKTITRQLTPVGGEVLLAKTAVRAQKSNLLTAELKNPEQNAPGELKKLEQYTPAELAKQMAVMLTGRLQTELMTCRDVAAMGRYPYTGRLGILSEADERKVDEALAMVHAQELSDRPFDAVSDGERQRILLSRAICQEPEIIVLDEPTSYLDIRHKLELLDILYKMSREQGITVVMSLHEIDLAMKISDRIICVKGEEIFASGKPAEVLDDETVRQLYDLDPLLGRFDAQAGSLELHFKKSEAASEEKDCASCVESDASEQTLPIPRIMVAASSSASGKTLITCGLLCLLKRRQFKPAAFKCGPDYIDPMFHRQVLGISSRNLDTYFSPGDSAVRGNTVQEIMARAVLCSKADISVIEDVMGYFDGAGASGMQASSCDLAQQTDTPVILVVSAKGMGRSIVPLLKGFAEYERGKSRICGVILNRVTSGTFAAMKKWIEEDTSLKVIGYVPQDEGLVWESRHLGLMQPSEMADIKEQIDHLADVLAETIDLEALLTIARSAPPLHFCAYGKQYAADPSAPRIAVARDEAFNFYYDDNLEMLQECGAQLVYFSPLHDRELPEADGILIGGGYPELYAKELSENESMRASICAHAAEGMPILAECGGFIYLQQVIELSGKDSASREAFPVKRSFPMCGVLPGTCRMTDKLVRFGYIELENKGARAGAAGYLQSGHHIRGHEFHYFDSTDNGEACTAWKPGRKRSWDCMAAQGNIMAGFPHLYYRSDPAFSEAFVERCRQFAAGKEK